MRPPYLHQLRHLHHLSSRYLDLTATLINIFNQSSLGISIGLGFFLAATDPTTYRVSNVNATLTYSGGCSSCCSTSTTHTVNTLCYMHTGGSSSFLLISTEPLFPTIFYDPPSTDLLSPELLLPN